MRSGIFDHMTPEDHLIPLTENRIRQKRKPKYKAVWVSCIIFSLLLLAYYGYLKVPKDKTVAAPFSYDISSYDKADVLRTTVSLGSKDSLIDTLWDPHIHALSHDASIVIRGKVKNIEYTSFDGTAWTKLDIIVTDSLKGNLIKKDIISVYKLGGCIPLAEKLKYYDDRSRYEEYYTQDQIENILLIDNDLSTVGEDGIFFLVAGSSFMPKGVYEIAGNIFGELIADNSNSDNTKEECIIFTRNNPDNPDESENYTLEEIKSIFK